MGSGGGSGRCGCWGMLRSGKCKLQPGMHGKGRPAGGFLAKIRGEGVSGEWDTSEGDCLRDVGMSLQPQAFDFQLKQEASKKPPRRKRTLSASLNPATLASSELSFPLHTSGPPLRAPRSQIQAAAPTTDHQGPRHLPPCCTRCCCIAPQQLCPSRAAPRAHNLSKTCPNACSPTSGCYKTPWSRGLSLVLLGHSRLSTASSPMSSQKSIQTNKNELKQLFALFLVAILMVILFSSTGRHPSDLR